MPADRRGRSGRPWERIKKQMQAEAEQCAKCGKPISIEYQWPHENSVTIGHIIPLALGGDPLDPRNLQVECIRCNSGEGTEIAQRARGNPARQSYQNPHW